MFTTEGSESYSRETRELDCLTSSTMARFFRSLMSVLPSVATERIACASLILADSTASGSLPKILSIRSDA